MSPQQLDEIIAKIDEAVGPPDSETDEEHAARRRMVERDAEARAIRKGSRR